MLTEYRRGGKGKIKAGPASPESRGEGAVWIDAVNPTDEELAQLSRIMGFAVPNQSEITEIELSARLYKADGCFVMIANLLPKSDVEVLPPRPAAFVFRKNLLLTIRYNEFFSFGRVAASLTANQDAHTPMSILCSLLEEAVGDRADNLETAMRHLEDLTSRLFRHRVSGGDKKLRINMELEATLRRLGGMGDRVSNIRESIASLQRAVNFAKTYIPESWQGGQAAVLDSLKIDLTALSDEAGFFMNKLTFTLDATLGMINIEETKVIRVLSVVTLLLSPPVLIAGIYGMNFRVMPELEWPLGYAFSLALMAASAAVSLWYLRRKRWI